MGCDIHLFIECKETINGKKKWVSGDYYKINPYYEEFDNEKKYEVVNLYDDRNYALFSILADVRNYSGNEYIDEPRRLPNDCCEEIRKESEDWGIDGHSHSYFTLKELIDFQKNIKPLKRSGMISPEAQKALDEKGIFPEEWCQWTNHEGWQFRKWEVKNTILEPLIEAIKERAADLYFISRWKWEHEYEDAYKQSDKIRIVFWFDN